MSKQITGKISLAENLGGNFADAYADTIAELKRNAEEAANAYGVAEIEAIKTTIIYFQTNGDARTVQLAELIENLESAVRAIQTHVLPEDHPMAVN